MKTSSKALFAILLALLAANCKPKESAPSTPDAASEPVAAEPQPEPAPTPIPEPVPQPEPRPAPVAPEKLEVGDRVSLDALTTAAWIQGEAPTEFEPGKVYLFECWATWCGPCIRIIPHVNELHEAYYDKGLRVYGVNVFEDGQEKVAEFVKKKGEGMKYPVVYTGRGSMFEKHWLKPAGVRGIPHAFVVIDGVLRLKTHPARISKELIESLLKGGDEARRTLDALSASDRAEGGESSVMRDFQEAILKGDQAAMEKLVADLERKEPKSPFIHMMKLDIMIVKQQWQELDAKIMQNPATPEERTAVGYVASRLGMADPGFVDAPETLLKKTSEVYARELEKREKTNPMEWIALGSLQFKCDDKEVAKATIAKAAEVAESMPKGRGLPPAIFVKFKQAVDAGRLPTSEEFGKWVQEAYAKKS